MRMLPLRRWLLVAGALALLAALPGATRWGDALGKSKAAPPVRRAVSFLKEVRPILAQHCFGCHGPDEAARKGKLRLDLKDHAFARRNDAHVIAPGDLDGSIAWERITTEDDHERMPPKGKADPLSKTQIATLKAWIEQGAKWEDHWSFLPPRKPALPRVANSAWVRDPLDTFVLARLEREKLAPEAEATREAWLRRASFDLTGLPPTPAEIDEFLKDRRSNAYEHQADRLLKSPRHGERQAQEWLDLARYADTGGYQNDSPRSVWKWREWVVNAYNANMPFDQFAIEQLAGDLLPKATLSQRVATGFNRNHPTNSEAGEEEDEYRSAYVIDRVNTTATVFLGLTLACAQCHDHKYDPISQRDYYSFYSFFNNIKERDSDFGNPRPSIPVPSADQEPRLADLKTRIDALKRRLEREDPLTDAAQKEWEKKTLASLGKPIEWTTARPSGMLSRNGSLLKLLDDGSILSTGAAPVKDTYDVMLLPGKRRITALRLEVLPDASQPEHGLGRASDGRFMLSAIEIRHTTFAEAQEPPLVYVSRAEADINQKPREDPFGFGMMPGSIESAIVVDGGLANRRFGGWSIVDDERKKPHEAIFLPLEPLDTNEASILRFSLHHSEGFKFKSLIGRFRISYTEDNRIRDILLPAQTKLWSSIGPFPAADVTKAYRTAFDLEKAINSEPLDLKASYDKVVLPPPPAPTGPVKPTPEKKGDDKTKPAEVAKPKPKPEKINWAEQRRWRDGTMAQLQGVNVAHYLTRKIVSTRPRTATVQIDGPPGFKVWLNGELVHTVVPPPLAPPSTPLTGPPKPGDDDNDPPASPELDSSASGRGRSTPDRKFRIGLRQGENEIVVKAVFGMNGTFTFHLTPEGDDVVNHEVATALRLEALALAGSLKEAPTSPANNPSVARQPDPTKLPVKEDEQKKVSLVGEKSAPLKSYEEENKLTPSQRRQKVLREYFRSHLDPIGRILAEELAKLKDEERQVKARIPQTLVMEELEKPRQAYVFLRGLYKNRGANVDPTTPAVLSPLAKELPRNRLGLARWLVAAEQPLTARVLINRIWMQYFGHGIVRTAEDFGIRAEVPTHPELLDYLASELIDNKWDLKKLHKRIVLSATYRQAATVSKEKLERDPENILLSRGPRLRLTAEMIRDNALSVSGLLHEKIGGESVKPVQPRNAWNTFEGNMGNMYRRDRDEKQYRRALYVFWKRGSPYPSMLNFDAPKRDSCTVTRSTTTTPLQALTLLNDPAYVECAKMLGQRMLKDKEALGRSRDLKKDEEDSRRLAYGFRLCTSRTPTPRETEILRKLLEEGRAHFKADDKAAKLLLGVGDAKIDEALAPAEAAAWASVGSALLNIDATIHR